jgi:hypothetical protein
MISIVAGIQLSTPHRHQEYYRPHACGYPILVDKPDNDNYYRRYLDYDPNQTDNLLHVMPFLIANSLNPYYSRS